MVAIRILACLLAAQIAMGARQKLAHKVAEAAQATNGDASKLSPLGKSIAWGQGEIAKAEKSLEREAAALPHPEGEVKYSETGVDVEFGKKKADSHSIKGSMSVSMDSKAPEPTPDESGQVPAHGELEFKADSPAQAKKLLENIEQMIEKFLTEDMEEMKEQLPKLTVEGSSIKLTGDHLMPYDKGMYQQIQGSMKSVTQFEMSHDIYLDLDMWVKHPTLKLLDVYTGMKAGISAKISEEILGMLSSKLETITSDDEEMASVKAILGDDYENVIDKLKTMLKGNKVKISVPGFDKVKEQMAKDKEDNQGEMTFNEAKQGFEMQATATEMTGNAYAVAALNLVQQAAAANLRFSSATVSLFGGAVKVTWTLEGIKFFNTVAHAAQESGAEKLVYGSKKPEEYKIPGVQSSEQIEEIKELGSKDESGAFAKTRHAIVLATAAILMNWAA